MGRDETPAGPPLGARTTTYDDDGSGQNDIDRAGASCGSASHCAMRLSCDETAPGLILAATHACSIVPVCCALAMRFSNPAHRCVPPYLRPPPGQTMPGRTRHFVPGRVPCLLRNEKPRLLPPI